MQWKRQLLPPSLVTSVSGTETEQCVCVLKKFLGSGEREREGEQVLLTWALGSANTFYLQQAH
jgi:hypothetical protein